MHVLSWAIMAFLVPVMAAAEGAVWEVERDWAVREEGRCAVVG